MSSEGWIKCFCDASRLIANHVYNLRYKMRWSEKASTENSCVSFFLIKKSLVGYWDHLHLEFCTYNQLQEINYRYDSIDLALAKC